MTSKIETSLIVLALISIVSVIWSAHKPKDSMLSGINDSKCSVSSTEVATVGDEESLTVLAANETRAWAVIQQPRNATNTVALSFDEGAAAVLGEGYQLHDIATSTGEASRTEPFGRATAFPYTGAVTGITNAGTSSVLVTECSY